MSSITSPIKRRHIISASLSLPLAGLVPPVAAHAWAAGPGFDALLRPTVHDGSQRWLLATRMADHQVPGVAIAILRGGRIDRVSGYGTRIAGQAAAVGSETLFSVGSVSKVVTAALCLKLVSLGKLDLDRDVGTWLRRWRIPAGPAGDGSTITLRMLLSHTAGFNLHGFQDFAPGAPLPTLVQTLDGVAPAPNKPLARTEAAGSRSRYSGGGYMIVQAVIEDALGVSLDEAARRHLFAPLAMARSRFVAAPSADTADIAHAHDREGRAAATPRGWQSFPELAPSGLWTTAADLARFVLMIGGSYCGDGGFLPRSLAVDMMTAVAPGPFGLGPRLAGEGAARIFHHAGANDSYKAYIEGNLASGDGLVVLTNGAGGDVLGDEIRNAVSDAFAWPGDWSVQTSPVALGELIHSFVGTYARRMDHPRELANILDTAFETAQIEVTRAEEGLQIKARGKSRRLVAIASDRFILPDAYIPAGTLQFAFHRHADRSVPSMTVAGGGGCLFFERVSMGGG